MTCSKTQGFLAKKKLVPAVSVSAAKSKLKLKDGLALLADVDEIYASKRGKLDYIDLRRGRPDDKALAAVLLGPTGNLRAPMFRVGRALVVGFDEPTYRRLLG